MSTTIIDSANVFYSNSEISRVIHNDNREMSIGAIRSTEVLEQQVVSRLQVRYPAASARVTVTGNMVVTRVQIPWSDFHGIGFLSEVTDGHVSVTAAHYLEWEP